MEIIPEAITKRHLKTYAAVPAIPFYENLKDYVKLLPVDDTLKEYILEERFIKENPSFYSYYPLLFERVFKPIGDVKLLSIAGFLYYKSILTIDNVFDKETFDSKLYFLANFCQEEAIKILTSLFSLDSVFWSFWNKRKKEYAYALHIDKTLKNANSAEDFERLAECKSAIGKVAIDALHIMSIQVNDEVYKDVLNSHKYFYAGFQILDDLDDLKEDIEHNQFNFAHSKLKINLNIENGCDKEYTISELNKLLYLTGTAQELLDMAIDYFDKSEKYIEKYQLTDWIKEIRKLNNISISRKLNIDAYIKNIEVRLILSKDKISLPNSSKNAIKKAVQFLQKNQNKEGAWQEWYNDAGCSDSWATAFILSFICQKDSLIKFNNASIKNAIGFLEKFADNIWGYNRYWLPDGDSTTFALLALHEENNVKNQNAWFQKWLSFQKSDSGFSTYNSRVDLMSSLDKDDDNGLDGWLNSHLCVSSSAFYYISKVKPHTKMHDSLKAYILSKVNVKGIWDSYWWTSAIYSTAFLIKSSAHFEDVNFQSKIDVAIHFLLQTQNQNGSFGDTYNSESAFYTALMVDALTENTSVYNRYLPSIKKAYTWLLENQLTDGSWNATPALRVPSPNVIHPDESAYWKEDTKGLNIRVTEFNRLFTSAIAISAIAKYDANAS
jgi:hypothetical protein